MADSLNQKSIYVETDYDNIILIDPNKIVVNNEVKDRLVDHEDLVFYANLETKVIPRTKLAIGESFDSPVINSSIASLKGRSDGAKINFLQPIDTNENSLSGTKRFFDTSWSDQLTGSGARQGNGFNQTKETKQNRDGKIIFNRDVTNYNDTQLLGIKDITVDISGINATKVNINLIDIQGRTLFEQGEKSIYSVFFNLPYPLFYLTLKGYYGKAIRYALNLTKFNASFNARTGDYEISLSFIGRNSGLLTDTLLTYAKTAPKMTPTTLQQQSTVSSAPGQQNSNLEIIDSSIGEQTLKEVYKSYKAKGLIDKDFPELTIDGFIEKADTFVTNMQDLIKKGDFAVLSDVAKFREVLLDIKSKVYSIPKNKFLDLNNYFFYRGEIIYTFKNTVDYTKRKELVSGIETEINDANNNLKANKSFGDNAEYVVAGTTYKESIVVKLDSKDVIEQIPISAFNDTDFENTLAKRLGRTPTQQEVAKFKVDTLQDVEIFSKKIDDATGDLVDDTPTYFKFGETEFSTSKYLANSFLDDIDNGLKKLKSREEKIEQDFTNLLANKIISEDGGLGFKPTIRNIFAILLSGVDTFYRLMDKTHTQAWNQRTNPKRLFSIIPPDKNFGIDSKNVVNGNLTDVNIVYPWPTFFTKERDPNDTSGREKYMLNYVGDPKYIDSTNGYDYTTWPEVAFLEDYINAQTKRAQSVKRQSYRNNKNESPFGSCNTLDFPFETLPYEDVSEVTFFYEIYERLYALVNYTNLYRGNYKTNQVNKFLADLEAKNIIYGSEDSFSLKEKMKNFKFNLQQFEDFLKNIDKTSWASEERDLYVTDYVNNSIQKDYGIYALSEIDGRSISLENSSPLIGEFNKYLKSSEHNVLNFLDTFNYISDESFSEETFIFLDEKKTLARLNESETIKNITLLDISKKPQFANQNLKILTRNNTDKILDLTTLQKFYDDEVKKRYVTEVSTYYNSSTYLGNVGAAQTTSYLNTPYFINSILNGVDKEKNNETNPYVATGYLFINSLPIEDLRYPILWDYDKENLVGNFYETIRKFSAIHQVPYSFLLKMGAFWHRYKTYHTTGVDILDNCWKDFDYKKYYDPINNDLTKQYEIKNYDGNDSTFKAYRNEIQPNNKELDIFNYGFYPKLINDFQYFFTKKDLFNDYTEQEVKKPFDNNKIKIGTNTNANFIMAQSGDINNLNRSIINSSYYEYLIFDKDPLIDPANKVYMVIPSSGGIPINQTNYECFTVDKKLNQEIKENPSVYNGTVRSFWGCSQFGYFDNSALTKPDINEELDYFRWFEDEKISGIYSPFKKSILDDFETLFLEFCNPNPTTNTKSLIQNENTVEKVRYSGLKQLKFVLKDLFTITESELTLTNQQNNDGELLAQKQIYNLTQKIKTFCDYSLILKIANSGDFDRRLFGSLANNPILKPLDPILPTGAGYIKGTLPGDGSNVSILQSKTLSTQNAEAWTSLYLNVGSFFEISSNPGLNYSEYKDSGSTIFDFFIDNNIEFNKSNVEVYSKLIKIYSTQKNKKRINNETYGNTEFISDLENFLLEKNKILDDSIVEVFTYLNKNLPTVTINNKNTKSTLDGNISKLSLYNTFQAFNDKWIAGSDLTTRTIFEDFLFHDAANHDIGDELQVDIFAVKEILKTSDPATDILLIIGSILKVAGDLLFFSMPAYINFYGVNNPTKKPNPINIDVPNSLFGTWTNVNYIDSRPKFLCVYAGKESERPESKDNDFVLYANDSFDFRNPTTVPVRIEPDKQNLSKSNKVVAFNVDFGIRNQNIFESINVSMNDKKPTNATFLVNDQLANGVNADKIAQQTTSLYSLYKSMSYACTVTSLGNVMIQPMMYFNLRHVPLFYGPYYIFKVKHSIAQGKFTTTFDGSRMPKYALPQADNLATFIKINYLENFKSEILKAGSSTVIEETNPTVLDPERAAEIENLQPNDNEQCQLFIADKYKNLPEEDIRRGTMTFEDLKVLINDNVTLDRSLKTLIFTIAITRGTNLVDNELIQVLNNNLFEISAKNIYPDRPDLKKWVCYNSGYEANPYFAFDQLKESVSVIQDYYRNVVPIISELNVLNNKIDLTPAEVEQITITQAIIFYWDTLLGFGPPPLTAQQIIDLLKINLDQERLPKSAVDAYKQNVKIAQKYFPL